MKRIFVLKNSSGRDIIYKITKVTKKGAIYFKSVYRGMYVDSCVYFPSNGKYRTVADEIWYVGKVKSRGYAEKLHETNETSNLFEYIRNFYRMVELNAKKI